jgi:uncharacterized caspase-like protein/tetratricopeptide (TPR) repeat protein
MKKRFLILASVIASAMLFGLAFFNTSNIVQAQDERERGLKTKVGATPEELKSGDDVQLWGVIIGVSIYKNGDQTTKEGQIPNLKNAADDAQAMYDFLRSTNGGGFKEAGEGGHLVLLKDENATKANVERELAKLKQAKPHDYFVLYIAAHGALVPQVNPQSRRSEDVAYFVLYDTELSNMTNTAIRMESFGKVVSEVPAKKGVVVADTSHAAGVQLPGRGLNVTTRANARWLQELDKIPEGIGYLSAADQTETSFEFDDLNAGVFTYSLLEGLRGNADSNNDGIVNFKELKDYVIDKVTELTERKQRPQSNTSAVGANYIPVSVVKYAGATTAPSSSYGTLVVRTPDLDGVEVLIDGKLQDKLTNRTQSTIKVEAGNHTLSFVKGDMKRNIQATVEAQKSTNVEVNLSFSEGEEDALVDPTNKQVNVFLREDKEPSKEAKDLFLKGVDSFNKQRFDTAIDSLNRAVQANGGAYADAYVYLGRAQQSSGKDRAAVESFRNALALRKSDFETRTLLCEARFSSGDNVEEVVQDLRDIIKRHPKFEFARDVLADIYLFRGNLTAAEAELRAAIRDNPKSPPAHLILADVLTYQDSFEKQKDAPKEALKALELFQEVAKKQVSVAKGLRHLSLSHIIFGGARYTNNKALAEANHIAGKALTNLVEYAINNSQSLSESKTYLEQARTYLQEATKLAQSSGDKRRAVLVMATSAQNHLLREDVASATRDGEAALKMAEAIPDLKDLCEVHLTLSNAYNSDQKYPKAVEHLQKYLDSCGNQMTADARQKVQEDLDQLKRQKDANRKK